MTAGLRKCPATPSMPTKCPPKQLCQDHGPASARGFFIPIQRRWGANLLHLLHLNHDREMLMTLRKLKSHRT